MAEKLPHMFSRGAKASHKRKLELAAKKPERTHTKKHRVARVRDEELHEHNTAVTAAEQRRLAAEEEANRNQDERLRHGGRRTRRTRRTRRVLRNPTRRALK